MKRLRPAITLLTLFSLMLSQMFAGAVHPAGAEPYLAYRYELHTRKGVTHYLDIATERSFENDLNRLRYWDILRNLEVLYRGVDEREVQDWLCPQVEMVRIKTHSIQSTRMLDHYRFRGVIHKRLSPWSPCRGWTKPRKPGKGPPPSLHDLPEISGHIADCLRDKGKLPEAEPVNPYAEGTRAHAWQEQMNRDWDESTRGSPAFQAEMRRTRHVYVANLGWVDGEVIADDIRDCMTRHMEASLERMARLVEGDNDDHEIMALRIKALMADPDPATRLARLQRLKQGIFMLLMAESYRAQSDLAATEAVGVAADWTTMLAPGVNDARDAYEAWNGKDAVSGEPLPWWARALAVAGLVMGSGKAYREFVSRFISKADNLPLPVKNLDSAPPWPVARKSTLPKDKQELLDRALDRGKPFPDDISLDVPYREARDDAARRIRAEAQHKVDDYVAAMKSRDKTRIRKAMATVQADQQAIEALNRQAPFVKNHFNTHLGELYQEVDKRVIKRLADDANDRLQDLAARARKKRDIDMGRPPRAANGDVLRVREKDVNISTVSNPTDRIKAGKDRDYTARIYGVDVPSDVSKDIYNQELFAVFKEHGALPPGVHTPRQLGDALEQTPVHRLDAEAYLADSLPVVLNPTGKTPIGRTGRFEYVFNTVDDPRQVGMTMAYKANENFAEATRLMRTGNLHGAEKALMDGMYQARKQFENQILGRIELAERAGLIRITPDAKMAGAIRAAEAAGDADLARKLRYESAVSPDLRMAMDVFRKVEEPGGLTPSQAQGILKNIFGKDFSDVARDLGDEFMGWEMLIMDKGSKVSGGIAPGTRIPQ